MDRYIPVSAEFREELEVLSAVRKNCHIKFRAENGASVEIRTALLNVYADGDGEFLKTESGLEIRLDHLLEVDGKSPETFC